MLCVNPAKTAEPIELPFGIWTPAGPRKHVLGEDAYWRHMTNTVEPFMCGGDAVCYKTTLTTCLLYSMYVSLNQQLILLIYPLMERCCCSQTETRMWANDQRDGRPAEYRWRPVLNTAKFG